MSNTRKGVPAGWQWNDGKPRWIPSPALRAAGWKAGKLTDAAGGYRPRGASIEAAQAIADAVAAWRAGGRVPDALAAFAPPGAATGSSRAAGAPAHKDVVPFPIGALFDEYLADPAMVSRSRKTQSDRKGKLKRLVDTLAGYAVLPPRSSSDAEGGAVAQQKYADAVAEIRASSALTLLPVEEGGEINHPLRDAYWALRAHAGVHQAAGVMSATSAWLTWCHGAKSRSIESWVDFPRETPPGRIRAMTWPEISALVTAADAMGKPWIADGLILAIDLGWSEETILALTWPQIIRTGPGRRTVHSQRAKTNRKGGTPLLDMGVRRLVEIRRRQRRMTARPLRVVHIERERWVGRKPGPDQDADYFRKTFAKVRAEAAKTCPSVAGLQFADTRDTGFTLTKRAGLTDSGTASRSLHSLKTVKAMGDKHYGEVGAEIAEPAADQLNAYVEAQIKKAGVKL